MKSKFNYKIKHHLTFCAYEKMWITLTILMAISVFIIIRGSSAELLIDTAITRFLFCSDVNEDKTLYNIAVGNLSAYVFYVLQVYIPERKKTRRALRLTALDTYNLINQTLLFLFVWDRMTEKTSDGTIMGIRCHKFYYINQLYEMAHEADINELEKISLRVKDDYENVMKNHYFQVVDENIYNLFNETNIAEEIRGLYILLQSAETASNTCATIFETYSPKQVELLKIKMMLLKELYGIDNIASYEETNDIQEIQKWERFKKESTAMIVENLEFFRNLPEGYQDVIK